jgi:BirA family biotin operon repressor/biotin-[acetyl-CoA-carboxylase] ligase
MPKRSAPPPASTDRRLDKLLALLVEHPMVVLSGAKIARQVGVSRSAVWRWVETLRGLGVRIKGHPKTGYQLERVPDILVPQLVRDRLEATPFGRRIHHFFKTDSTNNAALALAAAGEPHGALVLAEEQTSGRGRLGRAWHSEKTTGLYFSILLRPALAPQQAPLLTLAAGLAARDAIAAVTSLEADLKWPNDLLVGGKKVGGILTEMQAETQRIHYVVVGIGLNVNHAKLPAELSAATSLRLAAGREVSRAELLVHLLAAFDRYYNRLLREGAAPLISRFSEVSSYASGKRVLVTGFNEKMSGVTAGLDPTGCLLVKRDADGQTVPVLAGDVTEA